MLTIMPILTLIGFSRLRRSLCLLVLLLLSQPGIAQDLPSCFDRPTFRDPPWVDGNLFCPEGVIEEATAGELPFDALATAPDGTLYATRPLYGQVLAIRDSDGDHLPDTAEVVAEGLDLPNGLTYYDGALYIAAGAQIYRLRGEDLTLLVDDLPVGPGGWVGRLAVGPDQRLYVAVGASCDFCIPANPELGAILSFTLDGTDRQVFASGLRQAAGLAFLDGDLWATDSVSTDTAEPPDPDELNRVTAGAYLGWPYCSGGGELEVDFDCIGATGPAFSFPNGSRPLGIAAYTGDALPTLHHSLLVVLNGSENQTPIQGYQLAAVQVDDDGQPVEMLTLIPQRTFASDREAFTPTEMNYRASGFWPHRPLDVAVSPEGWVYVSVSGGAIIALRPLS